VSRRSTKIGSKISSKDSLKGNISYFFNNDVFKRNRGIIKEIWRLEDAA